MKILIVTSDVTFVPNNYRDFLLAVLENLSHELKENDLKLEVAILKNNSMTISLKAIALYLVGAKNIGKSLLVNSIQARFFDKKNIEEKLNKKLHFFDHPNSKEFHQYVEAEKFDIILNARTRYIYKKKILSLPKLGCLNIHHGLLPDFRGTMCDLWALNENRPTGFTIHKMERKIDDGAIVRRIVTSNAGESKDYAQLIHSSSIKEGQILAQLIKELKLNPIIPIEHKNISTNVSYTKNPNFMAIRRILAKGIKL